METDGPERTWASCRRWGRRVSLSLGLLLGLGLTPYTLMCLPHASVDSEVGVMVYGLPVLFALGVGVPVLVLPTATWGLGLRKVQEQGTSIPRWEAWTFLGVAGGLAFLLFQMSHLYWNFIKNLF